MKSLQNIALLALASIALAHADDMLNVPGYGSRYQDGPAVEMSRQNVVDTARQRTRDEKVYEIEQKAKEIEYADDIRQRTTKDRIDGKAWNAATRQEEERAKEIMASKPISDQDERMYVRTESSPNLSSEDVLVKAAVEPY